MSTTIGNQPSPALTQMRSAMEAHDGVIKNDWEGMGKDIAGAFAQSGDVGAVRDIFAADTVVFHKDAAGERTLGTSGYQGEMQERFFDWGQGGRSEAASAFVENLSDAQLRPLIANHEASSAVRDALNGVTQRLETRQANGEFRAMTEGHGGDARAHAALGRLSSVEQQMRIEAHDSARAAASRLRGGEALPVAQGSAQIAGGPSFKAGALAAEARARAARPAGQTATMPSADAALRQWPVLERGVNGGFGGGSGKWVSLVDPQFAAGKSAAQLGQVPDDKTWRVSIDHNSRSRAQQIDLEGPGGERRSLGPSSPEFASLKEALDAAYAKKPLIENHRMF